MSKKIYIVLISFLIIQNSFGQSVLNIPLEGSDCYTFADFQEIEKLKSIIQLPENKEFISSFDSIFGKKFDSRIQYLELETKGVDDWEIELFESKNKQLAFLKNYSKAASLSAEFKELINESIRWNYWHYLLAYPILRSNKDTQMKRLMSLPRIMTDDLAKQTIDSPSALSLDSYRKFLPFYITYFNSQEKQFVKYSDMVKATTDKVNFAQNKLTENVLDYTITKIIADYCDLLSASSARYLISQVYSEGLQTYLKEKCRDALNKKEEPKIDETASKSKKTNSSLPQLVDLQDKSFDFSTFKGKVIYVDFWASWCGPCRKEFPFSREMHEKLTDKQKKEIVFLYISIDEDLDAWKKAVEQLKLQEFGTNGHSYEVAGRYQIRSIPRYMIIDKKGEIVEQNATRPSSPETLSKLLKLIE